MHEKELREKQVAELRRREGLEDATCADPACDGFRCNKRYHLMANLGRMILAQDMDAEKAGSLEPPPPEDTAKLRQPSGKQESLISDALGRMLGDERVLSRLCEYADRLPVPVWFQGFATRRSEGAMFRIALLAEPVERITPPRLRKGSRRGNPAGAGQQTVPAWVPSRRCGRVCLP